MICGTMKYRPNEH